MFPGAAAGGDSRGTTARGLAALSTGIRRQAADHQQIPIPYSGVVSHQRAAAVQMQQQYQAMQQQQQQQQRQFANAKRSLAEMERQQLQSLHASALLRSVRPRVGATTTGPLMPSQQYQQHQLNYLSFQPQQQRQQLLNQHQHQYNQQQEQLLQHLQEALPRQQQQQPQQQHQNHHAVYSPAASSSLSTSSASGVTNPLVNPAAAANPTRTHQHQPVDDALRRQQHLEFAKANGFFPCTSSTSSGLSGGCDDLTQSDRGNGNATGNRSSATMLQEIARCLLDDDDDDLVVLDAAPNATGSEAPAPETAESDWSGAIEELLAMTDPQPPSSSASASNVTVEDLLALADPLPASSSSSASASASVSPSPPPPPPAVPPSPLQQQHNKPPLSPCTPSSSTSSTLTTAQSASPAAPTVSRHQLLSDAAAAIADGTMDHAAAALAELKKGSNPASDPPEQRLQGYLVDALLSRINPAAAAAAGDRSAADLQNEELRSAEHFRAVQRLHEVGLFFRLGVGTANLAILEAARGLPKIHVVDFDVGNGSQYVALLHSMVNRHRAALAEAQRGGAAVHPVVPVIASLKITAVADPLNPYSANTSMPEGLRAAEDRISLEARRLGIGFEFRTVRVPASELTRSTLGCSSPENPAADPLVVNFGFLLSKLADESVTPLNPRDELLRRVKSLSPLLVTVVEQEMNCNTAPFLSRFREASSYYAAAFESLETHSPPTVAAAVRALAESALGRKAANAVAAEGWRRVERCEVLGKWRCRLGMAGFRSSPLSRGVVEPVRKLVSGLANNGNSGSNNPGVGEVINVNVNVSVEEEGGGVVFGWKGRRLTAVSAWRC